MTHSDITIAIIGAGIGGVCLAIALGRIGYTVHLYEQAEKFVQVGAGIGIGPNAIRALELMGLLDGIKHTFEIEDPGSIFFQFIKWDSGETYSTLRNPYSRMLMHRARFLECLLPQMPPNVTVFFHTYITDIRNIENGVEISVSDRKTEKEGTTHATIAIGCDGIKSVVRKAAVERPVEQGGLGLTNGSGKRIRYTGTNCFRGLLDLEEAVRKNGEDMRKPRMWTGPQKHILAAPIEKGTIINFVAFHSDRSQPEFDRRWSGPFVQPCTLEEMLETYEGWDSKAIELFKMVSNPQKWALHDLLPGIETWTNGRITLLGDSAHASLPHNGAGAGQAIEDAYVLSALLSHPECTSEMIPQFLKAYEDTVRARAIMQQETSRETGEIFDLCAPSIGTDYEKVAEALEGRFEWIWGHDLKPDVAAALEKLKAAKVISDTNI